EENPIDPDNLRLGGLKHDLSLLFSAVVLCSNEQFQSANGFANDYWGWGFEDLDLRNRFLAIGLGIAHRKGTFKPLHHRNNGYVIDQDTKSVQSTPESDRNRLLFEKRWNPTNMCWRKNGLNAADFRILDRQRIDPANMERQIQVEHFRVEFPH